MTHSPTATMKSVCAIRPLLVPDFQNFGFVSGLQESLWILLKGILELAWMHIVTVWAISRILPASGHAAAPASALESREERGQIFDSWRRHLHHHEGSSAGSSRYHGRRTTASASSRAAAARLRLLSAGRTLRSSGPRQSRSRSLHRQKHGRGACRHPDRAQRRPRQTSDLPGDDERGVVGRHAGHLPSW